MYLTFITNRQMLIKSVLIYVQLQTEIPLFIWCSKDCHKISLLVIILLSSRNHYEVKNHNYKSKCVRHWKVMSFWLKIFQIEQFFLIFPVCKSVSQSVSQSSHLLLNITFVRFVIICNTYHYHYLVTWVWGLNYDWPER